MILSVRNRYFLYGLIGVMSLFIICIIVYLIRGDTLGLTYTTELKVESNGVVSEVKVSSKDKLKYHFENGVLVKKLTNIPKSNATPIMELPEATGTLDIENKEEPSCEMTWDSDLQNSANYIEYLKKAGYEVVLGVYTPDNIELFLDKGSVRKRVAIFNQTIMIGEVMKDYGLPDLSDYFK